MDAAVPVVLMPVWPGYACGLPMKGRCACAWHFGPVTFDLGDKTLTLCVSDGDGSTPCRALADSVSFLVVVLSVCLDLRLICSAFLEVICTVSRL